MAIIGTILKNRRAGSAHLAWNLPALAGPETLELTSKDFSDEGTIPLAQAGKRAGGENISPELAWTAPPAGTQQLLLVIEDVDAPTAKPFVHCVALIDPSVTGVPAGGLSAAAPADGVRVLRSGMGRGYLGPEPIKGHGPHRYVFQLFAMPGVLTTTAGGSPLDEAKARAVIASATGPVLARGSLAGTYER